MKRCLELPVEIWSAVEEEVISVTTRSVMRLVCKQFSEIFDDRSLWVKLVGYEETDADGKYLTFVAYCRLDRPHTLQYHIIAKLSRKVHCFEFGHQQLAYLYGKVGVNYKLPEFPESKTVPAVEKWMKKIDFVLDGHWPLSMSAKMYEDRAYIYATHDDTFLFLEFDLHCPKVKSYQWPVHEYGDEECVFNRPFSYNSKCKKSHVCVDEMNGLWCLSAANSLYFFEPSTRRCWGHQYLATDETFYVPNLLRAEDVDPDPDPYNLYGSEDAHQPIKRTLAECILVCSEGKFKEEHPYPKPNTFIVTEERLLNK